MEPLPSDLERLRSAVEEPALKMLRKEGLVPPFGAVLDAQGQVEMVLLEWQHEAKRGELWKALLEQVRQRAKDGSITAAALCTDGKGLNPEQGIVSRMLLIHLEQVGGQVIMVARPYARGLMDSYVLHAPIFQEARPLLSR